MLSHANYWIWAVCLLLLAAIVEAHPGPHPKPNPSLVETRSLKSERCASRVAAMKQKRHTLRKRKEALSKRDFTEYAIHAEAPTYDFIKNDTCILYPEETEGPYWYPASQVLRQDMRESEAGVPLELDIGVIDVATCMPLEDVLVDLWHCNATGSYSSFTGRNPNIPFVELLQELGIDDPSAYPDFQFLHTDSKTFLRGMWPTDAHGVASFLSIFPGFYIERTIHIHVQVHTNWSVTRNGTIATSRVVETGQIFFDEALERKIMAMEPYVSHVQIERTTNLEDGVFAQQVQSGAMNFVDVEPLDGKDFANGVLGYITLGIDTTTIKNGLSESPTGIQPIC